MGRSFRIKIERLEISGAGVRNVPGIWIVRSKAEVGIAVAANLDRDRAAVRSGGCPSRELGIKIVRERSQLENSFDLLRRKTVWTAVRLQYQRCERRSVRRSRARSVEVREGVRIVNRVGFDRNVSEREESVVHAISRGDIGFEPDLRCGQSIVVGVEINCYRTRRAEVLRNVRPERIVSRHAVGAGRRTVTKCDRHRVRRVLSRAAIPGAVTKENVLELRCRIRRRSRIRSADDHLHLRAGSAQSRNIQLDRPIVDEVIRR